MSDYNKPVEQAFAVFTNYLVDECHGRAKHAGWWTDINTGEPLERNKGEMLALIHSEVSEVLEGVRKNSMDDHIPSRYSEEVELADVLIRVFDYAGGFNLDVGAALVEKMNYNRSRADHKIENRLKGDGKKI